MTTDQDWGAWEEEIGDPEPSRELVLPERRIPKAELVGKLSKGAQDFAEVVDRWRRRVGHEVRCSPWTLLRFLIWLPHGCKVGARTLWTGFWLILALWWKWVTCNEGDAGLAASIQQAFDKGRAPSAEEIEQGRKPTQTPTQKVVELYRFRRSRWLITLALLAVVLNAPWVLDLFAEPYAVPLVGTLPWSPTLYQVYGLLWLGACWEVGRRYVPPLAEPDDESRILLHPNIPIGQLRKGIEKFFESYGYTFKLTTTDVDSHAFRFGYNSPGEITDFLLRQLERSIGAAPKSIKRHVDTGDSASGVLVIMTSDPLEHFVPSPTPREPKTRTILKPLDLGPCEDGSVTAISMAHCPVCIVVGQTGSGKSGITNNLVERLHDTYDGDEIYCIDPTDGPDSNVLAGFYAAFNGKKVITEEHEAEALIDWALSDCRERNRAVNQIIQSVRPDPQTGEVPDDVPRNHHPTREAKQRWIVIEEYPQTRVWGDFTKKVERLARICRKAAWGLIIVSQSATRTNGLGSTVLQNQATVRLVGSTKPGELPYAIGQGAEKQGFHPELLIPATKTTLNDAGKFYALSSDRWDPVLTRAWGLDFSEIIRRVWERTGEWRPEVLGLESDYAEDRDGDGIPDEYDDDPDDPENRERAEWMYNDQNETSTEGGMDPEDSAGPGSSSSSTAESPGSSNTPRLLTLLLEVSDATDSTRIPTRYIMEHLQTVTGPMKSWDVNQLGNALRQLGMPRSKPLGKGSWGNSAKGYRRADVQAVIAGERFD